MRGTGMLAVDTLLARPPQAGRWSERVGVNRERLCS